MIKQKNTSLVLLLLSVLLLIFSSCHNSGDIPFPEQELGNSQPVTIPLQFSAEKKLHWDTAKTGEIKPLLKKLDIDALPSIPYDTTGFRPLSKPPEEVKFDFNSLPEQSFSIEKLPSKPLQFKTTILAPPTVVKTSAPSAQKDKPLSIFDFGQPHGLQAKFITCLLKDKNGAMWIGSTEGLFRYDGEHIQTFVAGPLQSAIGGMVEDDRGKIWYIQQDGLRMLDPANSTLSFSTKITAVVNSLTKMFKDESGLIWVYNNIDKAVSVINPKEMAFKNIDKKVGLSDSTAFEITEDDNKNIWISTYTGGVNIIDIKAGKIKYLKKLNGLGSDTLTAITKDKNGQMWVSIAGRATGVDAINIKQGTISHYAQSMGLKNRYTFNLTFDNKGILWRGSYGGVELLNIKKGIIRSIDQKDGMKGSVILSCVPDFYNRMWVASVQGLNIIDQNGETVHPFGTMNIISIMEDAVGNLWVATEKGIIIVDEKKQVSRVLDKSNGLSNDFIQSFFKINGTMIVATNGGYNIIDPIRKTIETVGKNEGLVSDSIYAVFRDRTGNTWLTGPSNGVDMVDSVKKIIRHIDAAGGLSDNNIQDIKEDKDGLIWMATNSNGVDVIDPVKGTVKYLNNQPGLKDTCNRVLLLDKYGRMWIGTDKGIYVADTKKGTLTTITTKEGLTNNRILSLLRYNNAIIAGSSNKISIVTVPENINENGVTTPKEWKVTPLDKSEGLIKETNSWASDCITSQGQYLWGDLGITVINDIKSPDDSVVTYITGMNLMTQPQYFANKKELKATDTLWTTDTFYVKGQGQVNAGYTAIKGLNWDSVTGPFNLPVNLSIPYKQNYLQFQFVQPHLSRQDTTWYTYTLEGIDTKWSTPTTNTFTENYLNLPPQKYSFKVSSKGIGGKWSTPAIFNFTISPPWYQTWWAYTLFGLLAAGLLRAYIVYRSRMLQRENKVLEEKVKLRTTQLQESIEDLKATQSQLVQSEKMASLGELTAGIAHEIQNPLNFINNFSEVNTELVEEMKTELKAGNNEAAILIAEDIAANEQKINHHGKRADSIVKGMLQHSRSSNGIKEPTNINKLADEYLRLAYHGLRAKDKSFNALMKTDFDESIESINIIPQDLGRVILNLITNAFYAVTEKKKNLASAEEGTENSNTVYDPTVTVITKKLNSTSGEGARVEIIVKDNGNGIPRKVLDKIFQPFFTTKPTGEGTGLGLSMSYDIITKGHGGQLTVKTNEGEGSQFIITLPT